MVRLKKAFGAGQHCLPRGFPNFGAIVAARLSQRARAGEVLFSNALKLSLDGKVDSTIPLLALPPLTLRGRSNPIDIFCVPVEKRIDLRH